MRNIANHLISVGIALIGVIGLGSGAVFAQDRALIVANSSYDTAPDLREARLVLGAAVALQGAGYQTQFVDNLDSSAFRAALTRFAAEAEADVRVIIVFAGHVLTNGAEAYLTPTDLKDPQALTIGFDAPALSALLSLAGEYPGGAGIFLGYGNAESGLFGANVAGFGDVRGLEPGLGQADIPQGVLLVSGPPKEIADALNNQFLITGRTIAEAAAASPDTLQIDGYVSALTTLAPVRPVVESPGPVPAPLPTGDVAEAGAFWRLAQERNTLEGYQEFLSRYPSGAFAELARLRIEELVQAGPAISQEEQAELDLALTREDRRQIQRDLTILDHDPRGIDGLFGPATRRAISSWQTTNRFTTSGFLNQRQHELLRQQADLRGEQLAEEARLKAEAEREADIRFWNQTGASGQEPDLRVYLRNYPDGVYSEEARAQLDAIERKRAEETRGPERDAWDRAQQQNTQEAYQEYLFNYPDGIFAQTASERIEALKTAESDRTRLQEAAKAEAALGLNQQAWLLIERRLDQQGFDTGRADGVPTEQTRRAIRNYQSSADLPVSGFIDRRTLSRLILTIRF